MSIPYNPFLGKLSTFAIKNLFQKKDCNPSNFIYLRIYLKHPTAHQYFSINIDEISITDFVMVPYRSNKEFHLEDVDGVFNISDGIYKFDPEIFFKDYSWERIESLRKKRKFNLSFFGHSNRKAIVNFFMIKEEDEKDSLFTFHLVNDPKLSMHGKVLCYIVKIYDKKEEEFEKEIEVYQKVIKKIKSEITELEEQIINK